MAADVRDADREDDAGTVRGTDEGAVPREAFTLLISATRVADDTMAGALVEAERLLGAARDAAQQLETEAQATVEEAGRDADGVRRQADQDAEQTRRAARDESGQMLDSAHAEMTRLEQSTDLLRSEHDAAAESIRAMAARLLSLADSWQPAAETPAADDGRAGDGPAGHRAGAW